MGETAVRMARAANYTNAGTVEFLVDEAKNSYFLEMNTRLQVEHPVTELVTGLDLVQLQIRIAGGERLPFKQEDVSLRGHAIECRIYAEDPENGFMPSPGKIERLIVPAGPGIRDDSGVYEGWMVPVDYDPLLSKLIAWAPSRELAIARLRRAFEEYFIGGIRTNLSLFRKIMADENFARARFDTGTLDRMLAEGNGFGHKPALDDGLLAAMAAAVFVSANGNKLANGSAKNGSAAISSSGSSSSWKQTARREALRD
jgi:acetyl-CoA carboxylase biotin carboxylase subunit